jgi:hypothetical protein
LEKCETLVNECSTEERNTASNECSTEDCNTASNECGTHKCGLRDAVAVRIVHGAIKIKKISDGAE